MLRHALQKHAQHWAATVEDRTTTDAEEQSPHAATAQATKPARAAHALTTPAEAAGVVVEVALVVIAVFAT